jgi:Tfp pilus assembly protein PilV
MRTADNTSCSPGDAPAREGGFSLIEVVIALLILMVVVMGIFAAFTHATVYNSGNNRRSEALSVLQREVENLRSLKFNPLPAVVHADLAGGVKATKNVPTNNVNYAVDVTIDDDPFTAGVQVDPARTMKEITVTVVPTGGTNTWVAAVPIRVVFRRVCSN